LSRPVEQTLGICDLCGPFQELELERGDALLELGICGRRDLYRVDHHHYLGCRKRCAACARRE
jgi:hypothetical protein